MERFKVNMMSAQELLNGPGFDDNYMLEKAERELARMKKCSHPLIVYDHIINLSITLALISDWTFHIHLAGTPKWERKNEIHFCNWVRSQSSAVAAFIDISNECKHADRKHPNFIAQKVLLRPIWDTSALAPDLMHFLESKGFYVTSSGKKSFFLLPIIKFNSEEQLFYDVADQALTWWKNLNPDTANPMDKNLNPLT